MACRTIGGNEVLGGVANGTMSVQTGKSCLIRNFTTKSDAVGSRVFPTTQISITKQGVLGSVSVEGNRVIYKSKGPTGSDAFTYRTRLKSGRIYDYRVAVTVY